MERFWEFGELALILGTILLGLTLILLSHPSSRLRKVFGAFFRTTAAALGLYSEPIRFHPRLYSSLGTARWCPGDSPCSS